MWFFGEEHPVETADNNGIGAGHNPANNVRWAVNWLMFTSFMPIYCKMSTPHAYTNLSQIAHMWKFELASLGHLNYHSFTIHNQRRTRVKGLILKSHCVPEHPALDYHTYTLSKHVKPSFGWLNSDVLNGMTDGTKLYHILKQNTLLNPPKKATDKKSTWIPRWITMFVGQTPTNPLCHVEYSYI